MTTTFFQLPLGQIAVLSNGADNFPLGFPRPAQTNVGSAVTNAGNDTIYGLDGNDTIDGGLGNDFIFGDSQLFGGIPGNGADSLFGSDGNDTVFGGNGNDTIDGGTGNDILDGDAGDDVIFGGTADAPGGNILLGEAGNDLLQGGQGFDFILGGAGQDTMNGGDGNDLISVDANDSIVSGGAGTFDTIFLTFIDSFDVPRTINLNDFSNQNQTERLRGGATDDIIGPNIQGFESVQATGDVSVNLELIGFATRNNVLFGGGGNDTIYGGGAGDIINGGLGDDVIVMANGAANPLAIQNSGPDILDGGPGTNILAYVGGGAQTVINPALLLNKFNFQIIDTTGNTSSQITLTDAIIQQLTGGNTITLRLNAADTLNLAGVTTASTIIIDTTTPTNILGVGTFGAPGNPSAGAVNMTGGAPGGAVNNPFGVVSGVPTAPATNNILNPNNVRITLGNADTGGNGAVGSVINDTVFNDTLIGSGGTDTFLLTGGSDSVNGNGGNDTIVFGGALTGFTGGVALTGAPGTVFGITGTAAANLDAADTLQGGAGTDTLRIADPAGAGAINAARLAATLAQTGGASIERLRFDSGSAGGIAAPAPGQSGGLFSGATTVTLTDGFITSLTGGNAITIDVRGNGNTPANNVTVDTSGTTTASTVTLINGSPSPAANSVAQPNGVSTVNLAGATNRVTVGGFAEGSALTQTGVGGLNVNGGAGNDTITGSLLAEVLTTGAGNDSLAGLGGNDTLDGSNGATSTLDGGDGNDILGFINAGSLSAADTVIGGAGSDSLILGINAVAPLVTVLAGTFAGVTGVENLILDSRGGTVLPTVQINDAVVAAQGGTLSISEASAFAANFTPPAASNIPAIDVAFNEATTLDLSGVTGTNRVNFTGANVAGNDGVLLGAGVMNITLAAVTTDNVTVPGAVGVDTSDTVNGGTGAGDVVQNGLGGITVGDTAGAGAGHLVTYAAPVITHPGDAFMISGPGTFNFGTNAANVTGFETFATGINTAIGGVYNFTLTSAMAATSGVVEGVPTWANGAAGPTVASPVLDTVVAPSATAPEVLTFRSADLGNEPASGVDRFNLDASALTATQAINVVTSTVTGPTSAGAADTVIGGGGADFISAGAGADSLVGNGGNDVIDAGVGADTIRPGAGNDTVDVGSDLEVGAAGTFNAAGAVDDVVYSLAGDLPNGSIDFVYHLGTGDRLVITGTVVGQFDPAVNTGALPYGTANGLSGDQDIEVIQTGNTIFVNADNNGSLDAGSGDPQIRVFTDTGAVAAVVATVGVIDYNGDGILDLVMTFA